MTQNGRGRLLRAESTSPDSGLADTMGPMRILVLGGTRFLGRAIVDAALGRGNTVTLFNRGRAIPIFTLASRPSSETGRKTCPRSTAASGTRSSTWRPTTRR